MGLRHFINDHISYKIPALELARSRKRNPRPDGVKAPKYVLKIIWKGMKSAVTRVYFCKHELITDVLENWGKADLMVQQFIM